MNAYSRLEYVSSDFRKRIEPRIYDQHKINIKLGYHSYYESYLLPFLDWNHIGCTADKWRRLILEPNKNGWSQVPDDYVYDNVKIIPQTVIYLGFMNSCFGHWFTDNLRKIWFLKTSIGQQLLRNHNVCLAYSIDTNKPFTAEQLFFFNEIGVDLKDAIAITRPTLCHKIIIPDDSFCSFEINGDRKYTKEQEQLWNIINDKIRIPANNKYPKKLYLSRSKLTSSKEIGEHKIEKLFKDRGFTIIFPEVYPIKQQLQLIRNCDELATTEGSLSHLALFCKKRTKIYILTKVNWVNIHQIAINEYKGLDVTYIEAHHSSKADSEHPWWGPFYLCVTSYLKQCFNYKHFVLPFWLDSHYWKYSRNVIYQLYCHIYNFSRPSRKV